MRARVALFVLSLAAGAQAQPVDDAEQRESWTVPTVHALGLMTSMRIGAALIWPEPFADTRPEFWAESYERAFTLPPKWDSSEDWFEWDGDPWYVNAVGHALFGSEVYLRARTCRKNVLEALLFTTAASTAWEYGFEANAVRPSALDLVYTPAAGLVLGETRYQLWIAARRLEDRGCRVVLSAVLDPFGELERALGTPC
jgi:hypothetical protein